MKFWKCAVIILCVAVVTNPVLGQVANLGQACTQAQIDASNDTSGVGWFFAGCLGGLLGVGAAYIINPSPSAMRLLGKSPEYVTTYSDCYTQKAKSVQTTNAWWGCIAGTLVQTAVYIIYIIVVAAAASASY